MKILKGNSGNSVLLAVVKAFTTVSGILSTMIMSHALSLELYGTFSQTNLIVTTATNITALGLVDAVNYFYNRSKISRNYWLFEPKCRNNAEITYTQRLQIASYFP